MLLPCKMRMFRVLLEKLLRFSEPVRSILPACTGGENRIQGKRSPLFQLISLLPKISLTVSPQSTESYGFRNWISHKGVEDLCSGAVLLASRDAEALFAQPS